jgi:hypothetical protein
MGKVIPVLYVHGINVYGSVVVKLHAFVTLALDGTGLFHAPQMYSQVKNL